ncbi:hypothetical protein [Umezawaea sp. NPDC059074]|uniref:hypothetical protein n=1 Tax=Umezawaea sp. NPDC059074 TaxID=3346716 RepID=UPI0036C8AEFE
MRRLLLVPVLLLLTSCGVRPSEVILGGPAPTATTTATVYLLHGGELTPVVRPNPSSTDVLALLAAGPTTAERERGFTTEVPPGTTFEASGSTVAVSVDVTALSPAAVDQIACTAAAPITLVNGGHTSLGPRTCPVG